jgi:hypothetical protein
MGTPTNPSRPTVPDSAASPDVITAMIEQTAVSGKYTYWMRSSRACSRLLNGNCTGSNDASTNW